MRKKRKGRGMRKGSAFERQFCKQLSLWWTDGKRDDVFWRTSGSGARATVRKGKSTFGQEGDIQATDPIGQPLMDLFVFELKSGYMASTLEKLIVTKATNNDKPCQILEFIAKLQKDCKTKEGWEGRAWMLVVKQDYREVVLLTTVGIWRALRGESKTRKQLLEPESGVLVFRPLKLKWSRGKNEYKLYSNRIVMTTWNWFQQHVSSVDIKSLWGNVIL